VREYVHYDIALETEFEGALVDAMARCLKAEDPARGPCPYMLSGGTDAKSFSRLGMRCFGFSPLRLPPTGLLRHVPRRRRAGAARQPALRRPRARPVPDEVLGTVGPPLEPPT
jgi:hypothetical protein